MKIIIAGMGKVGYTVAEQLTSEGHDVTAIDISPEALSEATDNLEVISINGNGATRRILEEAGAADCDLVIALTGSDEVNILCCLIANAIGAKGTIARVRNPEYNKDINIIKDSLGLTMAVNPEREAAMEILRVLKFPYAAHVEVFSQGRVDLVSFTADERCILCGKTVKEAFSSEKITKDALICAVERGNDVFIPTGDFIIREKDTVGLLVPPDKVHEFFRSIGYKADSVKNTMIIGGGMIAHYLSEELLKLKMNITIVEKDRSTAENLSLKLPDVNIICGDGTNRSLLKEEGLAYMDAVCCLTGYDEENILLSLFADSEVPEIKTVTKVNKIAFQEVARTLRIGSVIYPKYTTANLILRQVRSQQNHIEGKIENLYRIIDNKVEAIEFIVREDSRLVGKPLHELRLRPGVLIGSIKHGGKVFIPHGSDMLSAGDSVVVITTVIGLTDVDDIASERKSEKPVN